MNDFLSEIIKFNECFNRKTDLEEILWVIFNSFKRFLPYCFIGISLSKDAEESGLKSAYYYQGNDLKKNILESLLLYMANEVQIDKGHIAFGDNEVFKSNIVFPLSANGHSMGVILFSNKKPNIFSSQHVNYMKLIAYNIAINLDKLMLLEELLLSSVIGFTHLVEAKDINTGMHVSRIQHYSKTIAQAMYNQKLYDSEVNSEQYIEDIYKYSSLHDIGKVGIPDNILLKPSKLSSAEFEVMKKHTIIGADVLRKASKGLVRHGKNYFDMGIKIAESHHENYDGSGYPYGLSGEEIPLCARIVAVADVFDALTSRRVYKTAYDLEASFNIINKGSGYSFDPYVAQIFYNNKDQVVSIYKSYNEYAEVAASAAND